MSEWHVVASVSDFGEEEVICVVAAGRRIALYSVEGEYYATDDACSHGKASLSEGFLEGYMIECPLHQGLIDVRNGCPGSAPITEAVASYPVKCQGEELLVQI
jgi:naphthalene 1,2-dioxygenase ferredoxin component